LEWPPNGERIAGTLVRKEVTKVNFVEEMIHPAVPCPFPVSFPLACFLFSPSCARATDGQDDGGATNLQPGPTILAHQGRWRMYQRCVSVFCSCGGRGSLLQVLNTTITTGGFITPKLYISRTVWYVFIIYLFMN
jgi:hypothetical protein